MLLIFQHHIVEGIFCKIRIARIIAFIATARQTSAVTPVPFLSVSVAMFIMLEEIIGIAQVGEACKR